MLQVDFKPAQGKLPAPVCIQLASADGTAYVFQGDMGKGLPRILPEALRSLLSDSGIIKACAGWKVCRDVMLQHLPEARIAGGTDIGHFAALRKAVVSEGATLPQLVHCLLRRRLNKDGTLRFTKWRVRQLTQAQACYACAGTYGSHVMCFLLESSTTTIIM